MTTSEVQTLRDAAYAALLAHNQAKTTNSVDGESQQHDQHATRLEETLARWDNLLTKKQGAGKSYRLNKKVL